MARIAILSHAHHPIREPYAGGLEMHTSSLAHRLTRLGHEVVLFAKGGSDDRRYEVVEVVPRSMQFQKFRPKSIEARRQVSVLKSAYVGAIRRIEASNFDYVINNTLNSVPLEWQSDTPVLTILHTPVFAELKSAVRTATRLSNHVLVTVSEVNAKEWRTLAPRVGVVHNGIDADYWRPIGTRTEELRWSARITPEKGVHVAIEAARIAGRHLKIAGPISDVDYFEETVEPLLGSDVEYVGHLSHFDLPEFLGTGKVALATPLWEEPFGLSVVEALACGTPVAALPRGAMKELISSRVGAVSATSSAASLASAIDAASKCEPTDCRRHVIDHFDAETMVEKYLDILGALQSESGPLTTADSA